jgi:hypothetical protein
LPPQFWRRTLCRSLDNAARKKRTVVQHAKLRRERNVPVATNVRFGSKTDMCSAIADVRFTSNSGHFSPVGVFAEPPTPTMGLDAFSPQHLAKHGYSTRIPNQSAGPTGNVR